jgi:hypothetical protein
MTDHDVTRGMPAADLAAMTQHPERTELETLPVLALETVTGGAGVDPAMQAKGEAISFAGTGVNGPPASTASGGGSGGNLMTWQ